MFTYILLVLKESYKSQCYSPYIAGGRSKLKNS